jgi:hypothetical protein
MNDRTNLVQQMLNFDQDDRKNRQVTKVSDFINRYLKTKKKAVEQEVKEN